MRNQWWEYEQVMCNLYIRAWSPFGRGVGGNLDDMVFEVDILFLLTASVLHVQNANQVSSPTTNKAIEDLEYDAWKHSQLREWVWQR